MQVKFYMQSKKQHLSAHTQVQHYSTVGGARDALQYSLAVGVYGDIRRGILYHPLELLGLYCVCVCVRVCVCEGFIANYLNNAD